MEKGIIATNVCLKIMKSKLVFQSFEETLKDTNLKNIVGDYSEVLIDSLIDDELLKEIPIVRTIINSFKFGINIKDRLFLRKIVSFLLPLTDVSEKNRKEIIESIDDSRKYRIRVGEKLLYIIDSCDDYEVAELISIVFRQYLEKNISYEEFLQVSSILKDMNMIDFETFIKSEGNISNDINDVGHLIHTGLYNIYYEPIYVNVADEDDRKTLIEGGNKYKSDVDGGIYVNISHTGEIILKIFKKIK